MHRSHFISKLQVIGIFMVTMLLVTSDVTDIASKVESVT